MTGTDKHKTHRFFRTFYVVVLLCAMLGGFTVIAQAQPAARNVLVLNSYNNRNGWTNDIVTGIESVLNGESDILFTEYMDTKKVYTEEYLQQLYDLYALKYHDIMFDVIITTDDNAYQFMLKHHDNLFKNVPVVFCGVSQFDYSQIAGRPVTGVLEKEPYEETLEIAFKLQPQTKTIYVLCDHTVTSSINVERLKWIFAEKYPAISYELLRDLTADDMSAALATLPEDAIVLSVSWLHDSTGRTINPIELRDMLRRANRPVFGFSTGLVGWGAIGGKCSSGSDQGRIAGEMARQVLEGADVRSMPVIDDNEKVSVYMFDYMQLQKYHISESLLPEKAIILNAPERFYLFDKQYLLGLVGGIAGLLGLGFSLVLFILYYRSIHRTAQDKEQQFRNLVETTSDWIWEVDAEGHYTYASPQVEAILGYAPEELVGKTPFDLMGADEAERVSGIFAEIVAKESSFEALENVNLHKDGREVTLETSGVPIFDDKGRLTGYRGIDRDITERLQTHQKLRDSEAALQKAQQIALLGFYDWDFRNDVVTASDGLKTFFGCEPDEALTFEWVVSRIHPEDRERFVRDDLKSRTDGVPFSMDYRVLLPDGAIRWAHDQSEITEDEQGNKVRLFGVIQDITERIADEQKLRDSEAYLSGIIRLAPTAIGVMKDRVYVSVNDRFCEITGYGKDELLGQRNRMLYESDADYEAVSEKIYGQIRDNGIANLQTQIRRKDGTPAYILLSGIPLDPDDWGKGLLFTGLDITEQVQRQRQLRFTQFALDHAGEAAHWLDRDGKFVYVNEVSCHMHGYTRDELMQLSLPDIDPFYPPEDWDAHWDKMRSEGTKRFEGRHKRKDGTVFPVEITSNFVIYEGNEYICSFERDITERKQAEQALRESRTKLNAILDHHYQLTGLLDRDGRLLAANRTALQFAGVDETEVLGAYFWDTPWWEPSQKAYLQDLVKRAAGGDFVRVEITERDNAGRVHNIDFSLTPVWDDDGNVVYIVPEGRDITELKEKEQALMFTQFATDHAGEAAYWMGSDAKFVYVNDAACKALNYTQEELLTMSVQDIDPDFPADAWPQHWQDIKANKSIRFESHHKTKDGHVFSVEITSNYLEYDGKEYNCAFVRDITERKAAEQQREELMRQLEFIQFTLDHAGEAAYWVGRDEKLVYLNEMACQSLGYAHDELMQLSVRDIDPHYLPEAWGVHWDELRQERTRRFEARHKRKDGTVFPVEITSRFVVYDGNEYICSFVQDITERKQAEEALQESENKHRLIFTSASDAIFILDDGHFVECNPQAVKLFGCEDASELISKTPTDFAPVYQEDGRLSAEVVQEKNALLLQGKPSAIPLGASEKGPQFNLYGSVFNSDPTERKSVYSGHGA